MHDKTVLHWAAANGKLDSVRVLLAAGAEEAAMDLKGHLPRDIVGDTVDVEGIPDEETLDHINMGLAAVRRELERGPAFRSPSWAWPAQRVVNPATEIHDGAIVKPVATGAEINDPVVGVRVLQQRRGYTFCVELVGR